jgi:hypothetical protein
MNSKIDITAPNSISPVLIPDVHALLEANIQMENVVDVGYILS